MYASITLSRIDNRPCDSISIITNLCDTPESTLTETIDALPTGHDLSLAFPSPLLRYLSFLQSLYDAYSVREEPLSQGKRWLYRPAPSTESNLSFCLQLQCHSTDKFRKKINGYVSIYKESQVSCYRFLIYAIICHICYIATSTSTLPTAMMLIYRLYFVILFKICHKRF